MISKEEYKRLFRECLKTKKSFCVSCGEVGENIPMYCPKCQRHDLIMAMIMATAESSENKR